jgi:hypothetical protein
MKESEQIAGHDVVRDTLPGYYRPRQIIVTS